MQSGFKAEYLQVQLAYKCRRVKSSIKYFLFCFVFASVFSVNDGPWAAWSSDLEDRVWGSSDFVFLVIEIVKDQLCKLNVHKPMEPNEIHLRIVKEQADAIPGPSQQFTKCLRRLADVKLIYKKHMREGPRNYKTVRLTSGSGKVMENIFVGI